MTLRPAPEDAPHCAKPEHPPMRVVGYGIHATGEAAEWWRCTVCGTERLHQARQKTRADDLFSDEP
jgi:hypothetical protein